MFTKQCAVKGHGQTASLIPIPPFCQIRVNGGHKKKKRGERYIVLVRMPSNLNLNLVPGVSERSAGGLRRRPCLSLSHLLLVLFLHVLVGFLLVLFLHVLVGFLLVLLALVRPHIVLSLIILLRYLLAVHVYQQFFQLVPRFGLDFHLFLFLMGLGWLEGSRERGEGRAAT